MPLLLLLLPFCMLLRNGLHSRLRSVHAHIPQANQLPQWSKVLSKFTKNLKLYVSVSTYLVTNSHVGFTCVVSVVKINFLTTILESKAVEPLYTVGGHLSLRCHILLWSFGHFLKEMQKGISLFMTLQRLDGVVRTPIFSLLRIMSEIVRYYTFILKLSMPNFGHCNFKNNALPWNGIYTTQSCAHLSNNGSED